MAKKGNRDWSTPENRKRKQDAFLLYVAGRPIKEIMKALGTTHKPTAEKFIFSEKWEDHKKKWNDAPDQTDLAYPWEVEKPLALVPPPPDMAVMEKKKRDQCIRAFSMYCAGQTIQFIADEIGVSHSTVCLWRDTQRWAICRNRLVDPDAPPPWEDSGVPTLMSDITASLETMKKSIKFLTGQVLVKAADAAQELDGMEALGMMRSIKQLAEATSINFSEGHNQQNAVQINIATKLDSLKIPEDNVYEAELVVNE